jgi:S1-C subfamily serine protease
MRLASPFDGLEVDAGLRPAPQSYGFDLERTLGAVVALEAHVPEDAFTAASLGTSRVGNGVVIGAKGLVLTIGYLVTEAENVTLTLNDGARIAAHPLAADPVTGFALVQALEPLDLPALPLGDSTRLTAGSPVVAAGAGGVAHAAAAEVLTRMPFAGYWEYLLDDAIMTEPAHPHWSGAALIGDAGELLGIGSLALHRETRDGVSALNMFVPIERLPPILDDLARGKAPYPPRPWLGVIGREDGRHVSVVSVSPGGPAARAELRAGDIVLAVAGAQVSDLAGFYTELWNQGPAGADIALTLRRDGDVFDVRVRSADRTALLRKPRFN